MKSLRTSFSTKAHWIALGIRLCNADGGNTLTLYTFFFVKESYFRLNFLIETHGTFRRLLAKALSLNRTVPSRVLAENINCTLNVESPRRAKPDPWRVSLIGYLLSVYSDDSNIAESRDERLLRLRTFPQEEVLAAQRELLNFKYIQTRRKSFSVKVGILLLHAFPSLADLMALFVGRVLK